MADQRQDRRIKCPHYGWVRTVPVSVIADEGTTDVVKGIGEAIRAAAAKIRAALADAQLDAANATIDMPPCPNCGNVYRYNARTGEVAMRNVYMDEGEGERMAILITADLLAQ